MRVNARADSVADLLDDIDTGMMMRYVDELMDIEAAQEAIKGGNYGACVMCHGPMKGFKRLIALPTAQRCQRCLERHERATRKQPELE